MNKLLLILMVSLCWNSIFSQSYYAMNSLQDNTIRIKREKSTDSTDVSRFSKIFDDYQLEETLLSKGLILKNTQLFAKPDSFSEVLMRLDEGTAIEIYKYIADKRFWIVKSGDEIGFVPLDAVMKVKASKFPTAKIDTKPKLISYVKPKYPKAARKEKIQGVVEVKVLIGKNGEVKDANIVKGIEGLNQAAIDAAMQYRFKPAKYKGESVEIWQLLRIRFKR